MHYILDENKNIVPCDLMTWAEWFGHIDNRKIAQTDIDNKIISTVFLGLDHNFYGTGEPLLFETMVFVNEDYGSPVYTDRCSTLAQANEMHTKAVRWVAMRGYEDGSNYE